MPILILVALLILMLMGFWVVGHVIGLLIMLALAAFIGYLADSLLPGRVPYGWPGLALIGLVGGWLGTALFGRMGPNLFGLWVIPAFIGALILTGVISLLAGRRAAY